MYLQETNEGEYIETVEDEDDREDILFENERCGICMDVVIDRGALDCCNHWFCFACIDNWATITNCCPICKNEFRLITCLPVYDTTGSASVENYLLSRDEDWSVQGKNNTLSFPSYYISEDAVACLDGDGCKVRSGLATIEDDLAFDTSIACDSCDIWYHAFCVGFHLESTSIGSWLCPRCLSVEGLQNVDHGPVEDQGVNSVSNDPELRWAIDHSFLGKVSVSVADDGETAVVVSMVPKNQIDANKVGSSLENHVNTNTRKENETSLANSNVDNILLNVPVDKIAGYNLRCNDLNYSKDRIDGMDTEEDNNRNCLLDRSPEIEQLDDELEKVPSSLPSLSSAPSNILDSTTGLSQVQLHGPLEDNFAKETMCNSSRYDEHDDSFSLSCGSYQNIAELHQDKFDELADVAGNDSLVISRSLHNPEECNMSVDGIITSSVEDVVNAICQEDFKVASSEKDNTIESSAGVSMKENTVESNDLIMDVNSISKQNGKRKQESQVEIKTVECSKKLKLDKISLMKPLGSQVNANIPIYSKAVTDNEDDNRKYTAKDGVLPPDIMSIVRERKHKPHDGQIGRVNKLKGNTDDLAGLRVKKIMRRVGDKADKEIMVQKLGKEIEEAIQDKTSCSKDSTFHSQLLTAFREVIMKPRIEVTNKFEPNLRIRKQLLKKGKIRENLTKKIYATTSGRRRRAWDRDWDIEFWKHRCPKVKPEKIETLQSVLELLKKVSAPCSESMDLGPEGDAKNSILSRVYLADASVFPRKDDIKPLSAVIGEEKDKILANDASCDVVANITKGSKLQTKSQLSGNEGKHYCAPVALKQKSGTSPVLAASILKSKAKNSKETSVSSTNLKETDNKSAMDKSAKRKWAMEILARKNASTSSRAVQDIQVDGALLKGNYPLLAQLPSDMRPVPAPGRQNIIPFSVRQAQLYRMAEHYLRRTNLSVIHRTADVELAVADAINVEKDISERSKSKMVYINLCAQILSQCTSLQSDATTFGQMVHKDCSVDQGVENPENGKKQDTEETISKITPVGFTDVEEILRVAGLCDSPPSSPVRIIKDHNNDVGPNSEHQKVENVLPVIHPQCTHEDSKLKLDDDVYSASSSCANSSKGSESENGNVTIKSILSPPEEPFKYSNYDSSKSKSSAEMLSVNNQENGVVEAPSSKSKSSAEMLSVNNQDNVVVEAPSSNCLNLLQQDNSCGKGNVLVKFDSSTPIFQQEKLNELSSPEPNKLHEPKKEPLTISTDVIGEDSNVMEREDASSSGIINKNKCDSSKDGSAVPKLETNSLSENSVLGDEVPLKGVSSRGKSSSDSLSCEVAPNVELSKPSGSSSSEPSHSVYKKVEAYIKEHIRPLCKSGVITVEQYRWVVGRTTDKVMGYHGDAKTANFLIKEGDKVKKLAEQYIEVAQKKM
ncbi:uncharacterized protein At4g10930-like isoform X1 [Zingiber officinale]|uniref:uncharacterized protein At4g10930-like isoform X1 n=1 Tax=Zingiber officinale TaxID=94328 RepID=UPI001C4BCE7C|nr:uncharacterized protein At4g10930-like isoform X1 [Zingiber officinale]XP_042383346.1 uncharacterized protein At4g10930-like isoform X1 [Zingiber officinale]